MIAANSDIGVLYGTFAFLRRMQTGQALDSLAVTDAPKLMVRTPALPNEATRRPSRSNLQTAKTVVPSTLL